MPSPPPTTYAGFKNNLPTYPSFLTCLAAIYANANVYTATSTPISTIRDSTTQTATLKAGGLEDRLLYLLASVALQKPL